MEEEWLFSCTLHALCARQGELVTGRRLDHRMLAQHSDLPVVVCESVAVAVKMRQHQRQ